MFGRSQFSVLSSSFHANQYDIQVNPISSLSMHAFLVSLATSAGEQHPLGANRSSRQREYESCILRTANPRTLTVSNGSSSQIILLPSINNGEG